MFVNLLVSQDGGDKYYGKLLVENNLVLRLHIHRTIHMVLAQQEQISMATYQIHFSDFLWWQCIFESALLSLAEVLLVNNGFCIWLSSIQICSLTTELIDYTG